MRLRVSGAQTEVAIVHHERPLAAAAFHRHHFGAAGDDEIAWSEKVVKAFNDNPASGVVKIDGKMIDKPHLRAAEKILALRAR